MRYLIDYILYHLYNFTNRGRRDFSNRLFVCGCPRSGTTAVWRLLTRHPKIGMGVERYINRVDGNFIQLTPELFKKERFFNIQSGDTHFKDLSSGGAGKYYRDLEPRYNECKWLGDKAPVLYKNYGGLFFRFPNARVVYVIRDIYDIALSYEVRFADKLDSWKLDYSDAVEAWNASLLTTLKYKEKGCKIFCIDYTELFYSEYDLDKILLPLGLNRFKELDTFYSNEKIFAQRLISRRTSKLSEMQVEYIKSNARFDLYDKLRKLRDSF